MQNLKNEIERIGETLAKKSTSKWTRDYSQARLAAIAGDQDYSEEVRHMAKEAMTTFPA
jgi:hypothetical protein